MSTNRPPSCDLPPEFYEPKLKPCPICGAKSEALNWRSSTLCTRIGCRMIGPDHDPDGKKWNSIPRRSEVLELLSLVDEVVSWDEAIIDTHNFPEDGLAMAHDFKKLQAYADKLRKETGL